MSDPQKTNPSLYSNRHRIGAAKRLDLILAQIEDLQVAVQCILAEHQHTDPQQDARR